MLNEAYRNSLCIVYDVEQIKIEYNAEVWQQRIACKDPLCKLDLNHYCTEGEIILVAFNIWATIEKRAGYQNKA